MKIYYLDTIESISDRISILYETFPKYIYFVGGIPKIEHFHSDIDIEVVDILSVIKRSISVEALIINLSDRMDQYEFNWIVDIYTPFIIHNDILTGIEDYAAPQIDIWEQTIEDSDVLEDGRKIRNEGSNIFKNRRKIIKRLDTSFVNMNEKVKLQTEQLETIDDLDQTVITNTSFELEKVSFDIILDIKKGTTLIEIFDDIIVSESVPFASVNNFFKIMKNFIPPSQWSASHEDELIIKISEQRSSRNLKMEDYNEIRIVIDENFVFKATMSLELKKSELSKRELLDRFTSIFSKFGKISSQNHDESSINGFYLIPKRRINTYIISDIVLINPIFSSISVVNEGTKATKDKSGIHINFSHEIIGNVSANITVQKVSTNTASELRDNKNFFPIESNYLKIKIRSADSMKAVNEFQILFAKFLVLYDKEHDGIVSFYQKYIPTFGNDDDVEEEQPVDEDTGTLALKKIAPLIFGTKGTEEESGYSYKKSCQPTKRLPSVISDSEADIARANGEVVLRYPRDEDEEDTRNYVCRKSPDHLYPRLLENKSGNKDNYPYWPCCFNNPVAHDSFHKNYYDKKKLKEKIDSKQTSYSAPKKIVPNKLFGYLPEKIQNVFELLDSEIQYIYLRRGVSRNKSSFLNCVLEAIGLSYEILDSVDYYNGHNEFLQKVLKMNIESLETDEEREINLNLVRTWLSQPELASVCRQEMYDHTNDEIQEEIRNPNIYMDPRRMISLLEAVFNCNIFLFSREDDNSRMILPRHSQSYYKNDTEKPSIFIFEHWGSSQNKDYPQCELIARHEQKDEENIQYVFPRSQDITNSIQDIFESLRSSYILNKPIPMTTQMYIPNDIELIGQSFDAYGKCRALNIKYSNNIVSLLTSPIPPFPIAEIKWVDITKVSKDIAIKIAKLLNMKKNRINDNELEGKIGNITVKILIGETKPPFSTLERYNTGKRISRYVKEYMFWMYSTFIKGKTDQLTDKTFDDFRQKYIKFNPLFKYNTDVPSQFSMKDSGIMNGGKLQIKSKETIRRLMYLLKMESIRHRHQIIEYRNRTEITNFFEDVSDFKYNPLQVVLQGEESVVKWIRDHQYGKNTIHSSIVISVQTQKDPIQTIINGEREFETWFKKNETLGEEKQMYNIVDGRPYFFRNKLINDQIYLAQNTTSVKKATAIISSWRNSNINPVLVNEETDIKYGFTIYSYTNEETFKQKQYGSKNEFKILGYKIPEYVQSISQEVVEEEEGDCEIVDTITYKYTVNSFFTVLLPIL